MYVKKKSWFDDNSALSHVIVKHLVGLINSVKGEKDRNINSKFSFYEYILWKVTAVLIRDDNLNELTN